MSSLRPETTRNSFSRPSTPVVSMNLPKVTDFKAKFTYNYYVSDERTNGEPSIPEYLKKKSVEQLNVEISNLSLRVPRYVKLDWSAPPIAFTSVNSMFSSPEMSISANLEKIQTEETFTATKYSSCDLTSIEPISDAASDVHSIGQTYQMPSAAFFAGWPSNLDAEDIGAKDSKAGINAKVLKYSPQATTTGPDGKTRLSSAASSTLEQRTNFLFPNSAPEARRAGPFQLVGASTLGYSLGKLVDTHNANVIKSYSEINTKAKLPALRLDISKSVRNTEIFADSALRNFGYSLHAQDGKHVIGNSGFEKLRLIANASRLNLQVNHLTSVDMFASSSISRLVLSDINKNYRAAMKQTAEVDDVGVVPAYVGPIVQTPDAFETNAQLVGYLIQRSIRTGDGYQPDKTFTVESPATNAFIDTSVLFGKIYSYSIRSVLRVDSTGYDDESSDIRHMSYFIGSKSTDTVVNTTEYVPPPPPVDLNFVWDYKHKKLQVTWSMPVNSQRDITQFQVFRRERLEEPFELIGQKCFDFSSKKYKTGEQIDGNVPNLSSTSAAFVEYGEGPIMHHIDEEFVVDLATLKSSKYIYSIASIDAHGMISNYGAQFEVTFDFFKNTLVKKLISNAGAPRPYPNMYVKIDTFKDVIKTSGYTSTKMQVYFMPEYYKLIYSDSRVERMVATKQSNSYYRLQFINTQNQKSDSLKISIDDPYNIATDTTLPDNNSL